jgi:alpha-ribazole phosphatase CobZ
MKICISDATATKDHETFIITRKAGFRVLNSSIGVNGFKNVKSIINYFQGPLDESTPPDPELLPKTVQKIEVSRPTSTILSRDMDKMVDVTENNVTAFVTADYMKDNPNLSTSIVVLLDEDLNNKTLLNLFKSASDAKLAALWDLGVLNCFSLDPLDCSRDDSILVACRGETKDKNLQCEVELYQKVSKCVREATVKSLKKQGFPKDVLGFMEDVGVSVEDLVDAGMELIVGVEKTEGIREKLRKQILKSLEDLNVVAFIVSAIRLEEDFEKHRIHGVDVDDDPAYLYSDEVFGLAVSNQIAGTKATFNFKRYDEAKPGILSTLGPMLDDVFAGIIAGCTSKIFEE